MFEKEAEDAVKRIRCFDCMGYSDCLENNKYYSCNVFKEAIKNWKDGFQKGAEFGYNKALEEATHNYNAIIADYDKRIAELEKANEWHYPSKGEYPKDNSFVLVWTEDGGITTNYGKEYSDGISENGLFQGIHISDVIAWKEIVLPKEIKEK